MIVPTFGLTVFLGVFSGEEMVYFQGFFFWVKFGVGKGLKCDFFQICDRGQRGGPKKFLIQPVA